MESGSVNQIHPSQELSTAVGKTFAEGVHYCDSEIALDTNRMIRQTLPLYRVRS